MHILYHIIIDSRHYRHAVFMLAPLAVVTAIYSLNALYSQHHRLLHSIITPLRQAYPLSTKKNHLPLHGESDDFTLHSAVLGSKILAPQFLCFAVHGVRP